MSSTVLAVDDSVTMRRVLEITFAGPEFDVITVDSADAALQKLRSIKPDVVVTDVTLDPKNGYDLCKQIKQQAPGVPVLILSSKQHPFDAGRGSAAQADDHIDKPFDTQQMIDKVKKLLSGGKADAPAEARPATGLRAPNPLASTIIGTSATSGSRTQPAATTQAASPQARAPQRAQTLVYNPGVAMPAIGGSPPPGAGRPHAQTGRPDPLRHAPTPIAGTPLGSPARVQTLQAGGATPTAPSLHAASAAAQADGAAAQINGQMAAKLEELGLTPAQVDAVVALSREVVERVVWEVVPVLAETIIKEEIARITR